MFPQKVKYYYSLKSLMTCVKSSLKCNKIEKSFITTWEVCETCFRSWLCHSPLCLQVLCKKTNLKKVKSMESTYDESENYV